MTESLLTGMDDGSDNSQNLFVTPASGKEAASHVVDSIENPISKVSPSEFFDEEFLRTARDPDTDKYFAWGARPGKRNSPYWGSLKPNDYVLIYQNKRYTFVAQVLAKADNEPFAAALWGLTDAGEAWRHAPVSEVTHASGFPKRKGGTAHDVGCCQRFDLHDLLQGLLTDSLQVRCFSTVAVSCRVR